MQSLRIKMAENGFESNESYDYIVRCLHSMPGTALRCLNIEGETGRRKTAFANALAHSLEAAQIFYHDFTQHEEPKPVIHIKPEDESESTEVPPIKALDRVLSDACAFSEGEKTILILDQLHAADFKEHIRIYKFLISHEWTYAGATFFAVRKNLLLFLISEEPLYHSLQKNSFKVWVNSVTSQKLPYQAADFQLNANAEQMMNALESIFTSLKVMPTYSEYKKIIYDIQSNIHTKDDLCASIYGWTEGLTRAQLYSDEIQKLITRAMPVIEDFIGFSENVELSSDNLPTNKN